MLLSSVGTALILKLLGCAYIQCTHFCPWFYTKSHPLKSLLHNTNVYIQINHRIMWKSLLVAVSLVARSVPQSTCAHFPQVNRKIEGVTSCIKDSLRLAYIHALQRILPPKIQRWRKMYPFLVKVMLLQRAAHFILDRTRDVSAPFVLGV